MFITTKMLNIICILLLSVYYPFSDMVELPLHIFYYACFSHLVVVCK